MKNQTGDNLVRYLLMPGKPLRKPVAWGDPIVMNTREELDTACPPKRADMQPASSWGAQILL